MLKRRKLLLAEDQRGIVHSLCLRQEAKLARYRLKQAGLDPKRDPRMSRELILERYHAFTDMPKNDLVLCKSALAETVYTEAAMHS